VRTLRIKAYFSGNARSMLFELELRVRGMHGTHTSVGNDRWLSAVG
jgi:hypothetical protein